MKEHLIEDWNIRKQVVPGIKSAVLNTVEDITGEPLQPCVGDKTRGYREGTGWLHMFLLESEQHVFDQVEHVVLMMSFNFRSEIEKAKEDLKKKLE